MKYRVIIQFKTFQNLQTVNLKNHKAQRKYPIKYFSIIERIKINFQTLLKNINHLKSRPINSNILSAIQFQTIYYSQRLKEKSRLQKSTICIKITFFNFAHKCFVIKKIHVFETFSIFNGLKNKFSLQPLTFISPLNYNQITFNITILQHFKKKAKMIMMMNIIIMDDDDCTFNIQFPQKSSTIH